jgi:hypothetical protein
MGIRPALGGQVVPFVPKAKRGRPRIGCLPRHTYAQADGNIVVGEVQVDFFHQFIFLETRTK